MTLTMRLRRDEVVDGQHLHLYVVLISRGPPPGEMVSSNDLSHPLLHVLPSQEKWSQASSTADNPPPQGRNPTINQPFPELNRPPHPCPYREKNRPSHYSIFSHSKLVSGSRFFLLLPIPSDAASNSRELLQAWLTKMKRI